MLSGTIRVGTILGFPVGIHPLWFVIVALIAGLLGAAYFPETVEGIDPVASYALGLASALLLFASVLAHELGHAVVARRHGVEVEEIDLWLLGGVARLGSTPKRGGDELRFALAGPAVTVVVIGLFAVAALALSDDGPEALRALVAYQLLINVAILVFNMAPAFPLDGGRVLRALMWMRSGDLGRATERAAAIGRVFGYSLVGLGLFALLGGAPGGIWLAVIGLFVVAAGRGEEQQVKLRRALESRRARDLMSHPAVSVPADLSVEDAAERYFVPAAHVAFPVEEAGRVVGLVSTDRIASLGAEQLRSPVRELVERDSELFIGPDEDVSVLLDRPAFQRVGRAVVAPLDDGTTGIVSIADVERALRAQRLRDRLRRLTGGSR